MNFQLIVFCVILQLVGSYGEEVVHTCTLDDDLCGGTESKNLKYANNVLSAIDAGYRLTDVTSITKPTSTNELCSIPFTFGNTEYFHCRLVTPNYVCLNKNGEQSTCSVGKFFNIKLPTTAPESYTSAKIPVAKPARQDEPVKLKFSLYYMFECSGTNCADVADSITVSVNNQEIGVLNYANSVVERRWVQRSFEFETRDSEIQYVVTLQRPRSPAGTKNMIAIDQFELVTVGEAGSTTTKETTTDDQNEATTDSTSITIPPTTTTPTTTTTSPTSTTTKTTQAGESSTTTVTESESTNESSSTTSTKPASTSEETDTSTSKRPTDTTKNTDTSSVTPFDSTLTTEPNTSPTEKEDITSSGPSQSPTQTTDHTNTAEHDSTLSTETTTTTLSTSTPVTTKPVVPTTTTRTSQSTQTQTTTSATPTDTTTSRDESENNNEEPDSDLLPILLGVLIPAAFVAIAIGAFFYIRTRRTKKLAENWNKGADFLTDAYALGNVNDPDVNYDKREIQV